MEEKKNQALERMKVIIEVQSGLITATEGAKRLGVSRNTYYQWEKRAMTGMQTGLENKNPGRPSQKEDPEKEALLKKNRELEQELHMAKKTSAVRNILRAYEEKRARDVKKKSS